MRGDDDVQADVVHELRWEPSVDARGIEVSARDGAVTLAGHVASYAEKVGAVKTAGRVYGVHAVTDEMVVEVGGER